MRRGCVEVASGRVVEGINRPPIAPRNEVRVYRQGKRWRVMAELPLDVGDRLAALNQQTRDVCRSVWSFR